MNIEVTEQEKDILLELIEGAEETAIQGIDHADNRSFKDLLRSRLQLLESIKDKMQRSQQNHRDY
jgi:hypothetical protein